MPVFYFDIDDGLRSFRDDVGSEHADAEAARKELVGAIAMMANDQLPDGHIRDFAGSLRDGAGMVLFTARLSLRSGWV